MVGNAAVIAVNQDALGIPGMLFDEVVTGIHLEGVCLSSHCSRVQLWMRPLSHAAVAVVGGGGVGGGGVGGDVTRGGMCMHDV